MNKALMPQVSLAALMAARPQAALGAVHAEANPGNIEQLMREVRQELDRIGGDVKRTAEDALRQSRDSGELTRELKNSADQLLTQQKILTDAQQKLTDRLEQLETRNTDLEQQLSQRGRGNRDQVQSFGERAARHDDMRAFAQAGCKGTVRIALDVEQAITSVRPGGGGLIWSDRETEIVGLPRRQMTIRNLLSQGRTGSNAIEYARQTTRTNNARPVTEGAQKPESDYIWAQESALVRTIAHFVHVSRQAMEDAQQLQTEIDTELRYGLMLAEEGQLLKGDGVGQNLEGLVTAATAFVPAFAVAGETMIDTLRLALLQASLAEYPADGIVLHPTNWAQIELTKDGEFRYIFANVMQLAGPQLWGHPVVQTQSMDLDEFLTGAFKAAATIYDRMDPEVIASSEDRDNFIKNMITVRAEERLALAIKRPAALITGEFNSTVVSSGAPVSSA
ncbi:phage major capsid protein [Paracoccus versutus]|uniref:HK97 family phage major capsid protein n=1 Tax=Paracoccus versutus TaxID=34007 RepID=A0A3D9XHM5_PARVE|nr:phage major capsid protein [Paracoccus versutus]REF69950.1 HK97 family phage major capsid protein [Paracoccus versutus]WGR57704.1 phage major capsid protein [Paracoccus versutus]